MGWGQVGVVTNFVIVFGPDDGIFVYSGTPGPGTLLLSIASMPGTDLFTNAYLFGMATYQQVSPTLWVAAQYVGSGTGYYSAPSAAGPWTRFTTLDPTFIYDVGATQAGPGIQLQNNTLLQETYFIVPSGDTTGTTDRLVVDEVLSAGVTPVMQPGNWYVDQPITVPDQGQLVCLDPSWGIPTGNYGAGGLPLQGAVIQCGTGFVGASVLAMGAVGAVQHGGQRLTGITVSGTGAPAGTAGIISTGYVGGVKLKDVTVWGMPADCLDIINDGTPTHTGDFWQVDDCKFSGSTGGYGVWTEGLSDTWWNFSEATGNHLGNWYVRGGSDTRLTGCRGDSAQGTGNGFTFDPTIAGRVYLNNCEANLNNGLGYQWLSGSAMDYFLDNCIESGNGLGPYLFAPGSNVHCENGNFTVWVPLAYQSAPPPVPWSNSGLGPVAQYTWRGMTVEIIADMLAGTVAAGTGFIQLPTALFPAHNQVVPLLDITNRAVQGQVNVGVLGDLTFQQAIGAVAVGDEVFLHCYIPTDA